jgi:heterodisulfide reductase subunit C
MGGEIYETASEKLIKKGKREEKANAIEQMAKYFVKNGQAESIEAGRDLAKQILKK